MDMANDLAFLPLGGTGEIGINLNLYRSGGKWLAVDCGIGFGGAAHPEVDVMLPDPAFIAERRKDLVGLVITHAHEDHVGGVAHLWPFLRCPVYTTPFTAAVLRHKLSEAQLLDQVELHVIEPGGSFELAPFALRFVRMAHSIPEAQALLVRTGAGAVLHTGDWKLDPAPMVGSCTDEAALAEIGREGVLAMICDSTNATVEGSSGSESDVRRALIEMVRGLSGRVAVTCFASNVARLETVALAAQAAGRAVVAVGRSLRTMEAAARSCGYLAGIPPFLDEDQAEDIEDECLLLLVTGSQGEPRSALARIASDQHPRIALGEGDTVVFSSRVIPGNERAIGRVQDDLVRRGVRVIEDHDHTIHVSGHPARDELRRLYALVHPPVAIPVHGEWRHLDAHAELARAAGARPVLIEDGDFVTLAPGKIEVTESVPVGRLVLDGTRLLPFSGGVMGTRRRLLFHGAVVASLAVDEDGKLLGRPQISAPGLLEADSPEITKVSGDLATVIGALPEMVRGEDDLLREAVRGALRRLLGRRLQKRPLVEVHLLRL
jgi:ribonuclease J